MWVRGLKLILPLLMLKYIMSHPMWVRGLKHVDNELSRIEIIKSHPMWVRGLKLTFTPWYSDVRASHPMWVRGLKH